jgi:PKD repeat protein
VVTFATPGIKQVTLQVCNAGGCSPVVTKSVTVLDPTPVVTAASFAPLLPQAGQLVFLTGAGTGKPPLAFNWQVVPAGGSPFAGPTGTSVWWNTSGLAPGAYVVTLQLQNSVATVPSLPLAITLAPAAALDFYTVDPCRIYDSRFMLEGPLASGVARVVQGAGACEIPAGARALAANVTVISPTGAGNVSLYPGNYPQPVASTLNFMPGVTRSNQAFLPLATDGAGTLTALTSIAGSGNAHVVIDVSGYFAP